MTLKATLTELKACTNVPSLRALAKRIGTDHALANELWRVDNEFARLLAGMIADPAKVTKKEMEAWVVDIDSWGVCDGTCYDVWRFTPFAWEKAREWTGREEEFVRRAAFALMAGLAIKDKKASDTEFVSLLPLIEKAATDNRHFVKKAVNWALRQIGKRNAALNKAAIASGERIAKIDAPSARWIASDALRELKSEAVQKRIATRR